MRYYEDFKPTGLSFAERSGEPEEFDAAIGKIALGFSFLEDTARNLIVLLSAVDSKSGHIIAAQLSFRQKLDVLSSLVLLRLSTRPGSSEGSNAPDFPEEDLKELLQLCSKAEELRNTYLHSSYLNVERAKVSARAKHGLRVQRERVNSGLLLDVADFIVQVGTDLESVPLILGVADLVKGTGEGVTYVRNGTVIAKFNFGEV